MPSVSEKLWGELSVVVSGLFIKGHTQRVGERESKEKNCLSLFSPFFSSKQRNEGLLSHRLMKFVRREGREGLSLSRNSGTPSLFQFSPRDYSRESHTKVSPRLCLDERRGVFFASRPRRAVPGRPGRPECLPTHLSKSRREFRWGGDVESGLSRPKSGQRECTISTSLLESLTYERLARVASASLKDGSEIEVYLETIECLWTLRRVRGRSAMDAVAPAPPSLFKSRFGSLPFEF